MDIAEQPPRLLLSIPEVSYATGLSRSTIFELLASGEIESVKVGARRLVPTAALDAYVASLREAAPAA